MSRGNLEFFLVGFVDTLYLYLLCGKHIG